MVYSCLLDFMLEVSGAGKCYFRMNDESLRRDKMKLRNIAQSEVYDSLSIFSNRSVEIAQRENAFALAKKEIW